MVLLNLWMLVACGDKTDENTDGEDTSVVEDTANETTDTGSDTDSDTVDASQK